MAKGGGAHSGSFHDAEGYGVCEANRGGDHVELSLLAGVGFGNPPNSLQQDGSNLISSTTPPGCSPTE